MAVATMARQSERRNERTERKAQPECKGSVTLETLDMGRYVVVNTVAYQNEAHRAAALIGAQAWAMDNAERRVVHHYSEQGRGRHVQVYPAPCEPDGEGEFPEHDAEALRQFLADETGLPWRVYNVQGVDYTEPQLQ